MTRSKVKALHGTEASAKLTIKNLKENPDVEHVFYTTLEGWNGSSVRTYHQVIGFSSLTEYDLKKTYTAGIGINPETDSDWKEYQKTVPATPELEMAAC